MAEHLDPVAGPERHVDATQRSKPSPLDGFTIGLVICCLALTVGDPDVDDLALVRPVQDEDQY